MKTDRKKMLLPVEMVDTKTVLPNFAVTHKREKTIIVTKKEGPKIVHFAGPKYNLVPMSEILLPFERDLKSLGKFECKYNVYDDAVFYLDYVFTDNVFSVGKERKYKKSDGITPKLKLAHSYNGWIKFNLKFGYERLVCENGLTVFDYKGGFSVKHTEQLAEGNAFKMCKEAIQEFLDESKILWKPYEELSTQVVTNWEERILEIITAVPGLPKREAGQNYIKEVVAREMDHFGVKEADDWLIYNGINNFINHESTADQEYKQKLDAKVLEFVMA